MKLKKTFYKKDLKKHKHRILIVLSKIVFCVSVCLFVLPEKSIINSASKSSNPLSQAFHTLHLTGYLDVIVKKEKIEKEKES